MELRVLVYLAVKSGRALILPNLLADDKEYNKEVDIYEALNAVLWPSFRLLNFRGSLNVDILEPSFYWRIQQDYSSHETSITIPEPIVLSYSRKSHSLADVEKTLIEDNNYAEKTRIVLEGVTEFNIDTSKTDLKEWAKNSVGSYKPYPRELTSYDNLPGLNTVKDQISQNLGKQIMSSTRLCKNILHINRGNRSCFDKCR